MNIYELVIYDAEDSMDELVYYQERLFFSTVELATAHYLENYNSPNLFYKVVRYCVDEDKGPERVSGNWTRSNVAQYLSKNS